MTSPTALIIGGTGAQGVPIVEGIPTLGDNYEIIY